MLDPTLTSSASDKRKAPSLVAPSAAKKKRTTKKLVQFQTRTQQPLVITESANAPSTGKIFTILFF
jgi:hypothetical protein